MTARPPALFLADSPAIDFLNSRACPNGVEVEWLANGEDLAVWLERSQLLDADMLAQLRTPAVMAELDDIAARARTMREWLRGFVERYKGAPLPQSALAELAPLNALLERDEVYRPVGVTVQGDADGEGRRFTRELRRRWRSAESLLMPVADAVVDLLCAADFTHVKRCEGHACTLLFLDKTKGHARRWCSMAVCGNRAKQAAHRERMKQHG